MNKDFKDFTMSDLIDYAEKQLLLLDDIESSVSNENITEWLETELRIVLSKIIELGGE